MRRPAAEPDPLSTDGISALLARRGAPVRGVEIEPLGEGDFFRAHRVEDGWVLRVARHPEAAPALLRECCLLPRLASALPLAVPRPEFCFRGEGDDPAFALHRGLPGPELTRERYLSLPDSARERCAGAVGRFLAQLHATDLALPRSCSVPEVDDGLRAAELLERARVTLWPRLADEHRRWVERMLTDFPDLDPHPLPRVLLHGELSPDHVLYDEAAGKVTGVIDFGDMAIGDPAWDLVYLYEDYGEDFLTRALRAYPGDDPGRLARMRWHLVVDGVRWAVEYAEAGDEEGWGEAEAYLRKLREERERS